MADEKHISAERQKIEQLLNTSRYMVEYFQRDYSWEHRHVSQLIDDLQTRFFANYDKKHSRQEVDSYSMYYLGPILISQKKGARSIIDGQQRLTSLTLLFIYLRHLQKKLLEEGSITTDDVVGVDDLIRSKMYGSEDFNLQIAERKECMQALYDKGTYDSQSNLLSVQNMVDRYQDIEELIDDDLKGKALPYFIDWLLHRVILVLIETHKDDDAYLIFETMNDRGKPLKPAEMLKGYLIAKTGEDSDKKELEHLWGEMISKLKQLSDNEDDEFFKAWFRAKYAQTIRQGKKGSENEDFERIGTRFHGWLREHAEYAGLLDEKSKTYEAFLRNEFIFYTNLYILIDEACEQLTPGLEHVFYHYNIGIADSLSFPLMIAPVNLNDDENTRKKKINLVARFLETFVVYRIVNGKNFGQSALRYTMYNLLKEIRGKSVEELAIILKSKLEENEVNLEGIDTFHLDQQKGRKVHFLLARMTDHIERSCHRSGMFADYLNLNKNGKPYQIEHLWAEKPEEHRDEFQQDAEFQLFRNNFGALVLVQEGINQSYNDAPYKEKLPHYYGQNLLASSLNPLSYEKDPAFKRYIQDSGLSFKPHPEMKKKDILERQELYKQICQQIYDLSWFDL